MPLPAIGWFLVLQLFTLVTDASPDVPIPLPSYKQTPLDYRISKKLGVTVELKDAATMSQVSQLELSDPKSSMVYFGWKDQKGKDLNKQIRNEPIAVDEQKVSACTSTADLPKLTSIDKEKTNKYLQLGWLDGVGIYKGSTAKNSELKVWETESEVQAFDHLPLRAIVQIDL